jgi:hypothetical protein
MHIDGVWKPSFKLALCSVDMHFFFLAALTPKLSFVSSP